MKRRPVFTRGVQPRHSPLRSGALNHKTKEVLIFPSIQRALAAALVVAIPFGSALAVGDLTSQTPVDITVQMGDEKNALKFFPESISLETGKLYRLTLTNPSPQKHYFSSEGLAQSVFTRKVQVNGADGKPIAEVKGLIREIEVYPKGTTEWWFVPIKSGQFGDLKCTIPGHAEGGMVGGISIK